MGLSEVARKVPDLPLRRLRVAAAAAVPAVVAAGLWWWGPVAQPPAYHQFADQRTFFGIPNFWNVVTNAGFFLAACCGLPALRARRTFAEDWERVAHAVLLAGMALIAIGSGYYHLHPADDRLVWDRLPMTVAFTSLVAVFVGERVSGRAGKVLFVPAVAAGILSVLYWKWSGDLRAYLLVQICAVVLVPVLMLLFPARYSGTAGQWGLVLLYGAALLLDWFDRPLGQWIATGGHPWKHVFAAAALLSYVLAVQCRSANSRDRRLTPPQ